MQTYDGETFVRQVLRTLAQRVGLKIKIDPKLFSRMHEARITDLDLYHIFRTIAEYFRDLSKEFPWEFDREDVRSWTPEEAAQALVEITILGIAGNRPPQHRPKPEDLVRDQAHTIDLVAVLTSFLHALAGGSFPAHYETFLRQQATPPNPPGRVVAELSFVATSKPQQQMLGQTIGQLRNPIELHLLETFLRARFETKLASSQPIEDGEYRRALDEFCNRELVRHRARRVTAGVN